MLAITHNIKGASVVLLGTVTKNEEGINAQQCKVRQW